MVSNKSRLLRLYRYLYVNTDERHFTTKAEIMDALKGDQAGCSRQTVRDDIETLSKAGYDIETIVSSGNYYFFGDREFTLEELCLMGDAVASSRFIGKRQKASLLKKLTGFCSKYQTDSVKRHIISVQPRESTDTRVYAAVNLINDAINRDCRIAFTRKEPGDRRERKDGGEAANISCTPLDLVWDGRDFYLIALSDADGEPLFYGLKELVQPEILDIKGMARPEGFNSEKFALEKIQKKK